MSVLNDAKLEALLDALHAQSEGQTGAIEAYFGRRAREGTLDWKHMDEETHAFFRAPSFAALLATATCVQGAAVADLIAIAASLDPVMGDTDR